MIENETSQDTNRHLEITYNENKYRFVPSSNYWICVESENWTERWVICSDDFGLELSEEAKNRGHDIDQMLLDNKCPKKRRKIVVKETSSSDESTFFSLFEDEEEPSDDDFISLF